jgi:hypothetical protein
VTIWICRWRMNTLVTSQYQPRLSSITKIFSRWISKSDWNIQIKLNYFSIRLSEPIWYLSQYCSCDTESLTWACMTLISQYCSCDTESLTWACMTLISQYCSCDTESLTWACMTLISQYCSSETEYSSENELLTWAYMTHLTEHNNNNIIIIINSLFIEGYTIS